MSDDQAPPRFSVALPRHRYQMGGYTAVLLGEVESQDERRYRHILAVVEPGENRPTLFVTSEPDDAAKERGPHRLVLYHAGRAEVQDVSKDYLDAEAFALKALAVARARLGIEASVKQIM